MPEFIRMRELLKVVPISRASIWRLARAGKFPKPIRLSERCTAWDRLEVERWIDERRAA